MKDQNITLKKHFLNYLDWLELERGLSSESQKNYSKFLKRFFDFLIVNKLENLKPNEITSELVWEYRLFLSRQYKKSFSVDKTTNILKHSTQNHYLVALRSFLSFFMEKDIPSLPPDKVKIPKNKEEKIVSFLTLEQIEKLLQTLDTSETAGLRDKTILETFFSTGLRVAELVALNREQITIKPETTDLEVGIIGKGGHPRTVYFSEKSVEWIRKYLKTRNDNEKALFVNYGGRAPLTRLSIRSIERMVKHYALLAGLPLTTTCHTMRHSFATDLLMKGVDLRVVQEFLGHQNIATTQLYTHVTRPHLREIHKKLHGIRN
ncbi:MAG: tyrosine-type recombinase/integrase [Candidatus Daviesbacteria bacterium]|nr:tyrosine-type recombinase/integrase [Candidatus Daviesbacteria bacterium]